MHAYNNTDTADWWSYDVGSNDDGTLMINEDCGQVLDRVRQTRGEGVREGFRETDVCREAERDDDD